MGIIAGAMKRDAGKELRNLRGPVKILLFTARQECEQCDAAEKKLRELVELNDHLSLEVRFARAEADMMERYGVEQVPALVLEGPAGNRVRFYGMPGGLEFPTFLEALVDVGAGKAEIAPAARAMLAGVTSPVRLQVFVTPTCPWCPPAVRTVNRFATALPNVTAITVESTAFPELAAAHHVQSVPHIVINGREAWDGDGGDEALAALIRSAAGAPLPA